MLRIIYINIKANMRIPPKINPPRKVPTVN